MEESFDMADFDTKFEDMRDEVRDVAIKVERLDGKIDRLASLTENNMALQNERMNNMSQNLVRIEDRELANLRMDLRDFKTDVNIRIEKQREDFNKAMTEITVKLSIFAGAAGVVIWLANNIWHRIFP